MGGTPLVVADEEEDVDLLLLLMTAAAVVVAVVVAVVAAAVVVVLDVVAVEVVKDAVDAELHLNEREYFLDLVLRYHYHRHVYYTAAHDRKDSARVVVKIVVLIHCRYQG